MGGGMMGRGMMGGGYGNHDGDRGGMRPEGGPSHDDANDFQSDGR